MKQTTTTPTQVQEPDSNTSDAKVAHLRSSTTTAPTSKVTTTAPRAQIQPVATTPTAPQANAPPQSTPEGYIHVMIQPGDPSFTNFLYQLFPTVTAWSNKPASPNQPLRPKWEHAIEHGLNSLADWNTCSTML